MRIRTNKTRTKTMKTMKTIIITTLASIALFTVSCTKQEETAAAETPESIIPYPLDVCIVAGEKLGSMGDPVVIIHEGREIKFCCDECLPKFQANPGEYLGKLEP